MTVPSTLALRTGAPTAVLTAVLPAARGLAAIPALESPHLPPAKPFRVRADRPHLVLVQGGRAHVPAPFVVAPPAVRAVSAAAARTDSRVVRMGEADLIRCRTLRLDAR